MSQGTSPWVLVAVAVLAATAALIGAWIAAYSAKSRQESQLAHDREKLQEQLLHDRELHAARLLHDQELQIAQLHHARVVHELDDRRGALDESMELLLLYRERAARGLRELSGTSPGLPYEDVDALPALDSYTREDAVVFRRMEARLALRFGHDSPVVARFRDARDEMKRAIRLIQLGAAEVSSHSAEAARRAGRRAVKAFTQEAALLTQADEQPSEEPDRATPADATSPPAA